MEPFLDLTSKLTNPKIATNDKLTFICKFTTHLVEGASRVSLWRFNRDKSKITCVMCFDATTNSYTHGHVLNKDQFERYFDEIVKSDVINAADARNHEVTECFTETYFKPLDIHSLLDFILHRDFAPVGIICCESVGKQMQWTEADVETLKRIARASSLYFHIDD